MRDCDPAMANNTFRLESFRAWNPHEKLDPPQERLDVCRYPSPVSLSANSPTSNSMDSTLKDQTPYASKPGRHPLPRRPPVEVCLDNGSPSSAPIIRQPDAIDRDSTGDGDSSNLDFDEILSLQNLPSPGDIDGIVCEPLDDLFEQRTDSGSAHGGIFLPGQDYTPLASQAPISPRAKDSLSEHPVDPAILEGCRLPAAEEDTFGTSSGCATFRARSPKVNKVSVVIDNRSRNRSARLLRGANGKKASFSSILAHFSALTAEERMKFLSWLFEGALAQCLNSPPSITTTSSRAASRAHVVSCDDSSSDSEDSPVYLHSSRKGLAWSEEEDRLLVRLKEEEKRTWPDAIDRFGRIFPGRSSGAIKVHWSTKVSKRH